MTKVYLCVTLYHLYVSLVMARNETSNVIIILNANNKEVYRCFVTVSDRLRDMGFIVDVRLRNKIRDLVGIEALISKKQFRKVFDSKKNVEFKLYNFAWNCQYIYTTAEMFYRMCKTSSFIEEGVNTAINPPQPNWKMTIKRLTGAYIDFYKDPKVENILVQRPELYPLNWRDKLEKIDIKELQRNLDEDTRESITKLFMSDWVKNPIMNNDNLGIIFSQPLSEDGLISEEVKKDYYRKMIDYYGKGESVLFKIHPRDKSQYEVPSNCAILPGCFPSEVLSLMNIHFSYAIGVCSSAIQNVDADIKLNLNEDFLDNKRFSLRPIRTVR